MLSAWKGYNFDYDYINLVLSADPKRFLKMNKMSCELCGTKSSKLCVYCGNYGMTLCDNCYFNGNHGVTKICENCDEEKCKSKFFDFILSLQHNPDTRAIKDDCDRCCQKFRIKEIKKEIKQMKKELLLFPPDDEKLKKRLAYNQESLMILEKRKRYS